MMQTTRITFAERAGGVLGRLWKRCVRLDRKICNWLVVQGLPTGLAKAMLWIIKLVVLGVLFYAVFWLALILALALATAWLMQNIDVDDEKQPEIRDGHSDIGLYDKDDLRIDMGDPYDP